LNPEDVVSAALEAAGKGQGPLEAATGNELEVRSESASLREVPAEEEPASEIQMLLRGEGVRLTVGSVSVSDYRIVPVAESVLSQQTDIAGSSIVQRSPAVICMLYFTQDDVVMIADVPAAGLPDLVSGESADGKYIVSKQSLLSITRVERVSGRAIRTERKAERFGTPFWTDYSVESTDDDAKLFMQLAAAADANNAAGLSDNVFKQAECLRCSWRGYIDSERDIFDTLQGEATVVQPTGELQCPSCKRNYLREFYAADEQADLDEPLSASPSKQQQQQQGDDIWRQPFFARRNRSSSMAKQAEQERQAKEKARRARHDDHRRLAQEALALDLQKLGDAATDGFLPFATATNAISL
ncbi:hypothetical protein FBU59_006812, partial [Linderina macrospora]